MSVPFGDRRTKFPELSNTAKAPAPSLVLLVAVQKMCPWESDNTSPELFEIASFADVGLVIGLSRLAIHTTVRSGTLLYQIPMYNLLLEFVGEKKPRAKSPPAEMSLSLGKSGFICVS